MAQRRYAPYGRRSPADAYNHLCDQLVKDLPVSPSVRSRCWPTNRFEEVWTTTALAAVALGTEPSATADERRFAPDVQSVFVAGRRAQRFYGQRHLTVLKPRARKNRTRLDALLAYLDSDGTLIATPPGVANAWQDEIKYTPAAFNASPVTADYADVLAHDSDKLVYFGLPGIGTPGGCQGRSPHPPAPDCLGAWHTVTWIDAAGRKVFMTTAMQLEAYVSAVAPRLAAAGYPALANHPHRRDGFVLVDGYGRVVDERLVHPTLRHTWRTRSPLTITSAAAQLLAALHWPSTSQRLHVRPATVDLVELLYARSLWI